MHGALDVLTGLPYVVLKVCMGVSVNTSNGKYFQERRALAQPQLPANLCTTALMGR